VFKELKKRFTKEPVLAMKMEVNISDYAIEGILSMECEDERW